MEYGDLVVWLTAAALGASVLVIIGLLIFLVFKAMKKPPA